MEIQQCPVKDQQTTQTKCASQMAVRFEKERKR
jgi:hypothetical protein